jgi:hypothetical protein
VFYTKIILIPAESLKCYICNSVENKEGCGHGKDVNEDFLRECNDQPSEDGGVIGSKYQFCRKIITMIDFDVNNSMCSCYEELSI